MGLRPLRGRKPIQHLFLDYFLAHLWLSRGMSGNLYFAYDFEALTQNGWAFNVVNTADWVPEGPFSIQTTDDYNASNPFKLVDDGLKQLPFKQRIVLSRIYKNLETPPKKANKRYLICFFIISLLLTSVRRLLKVRQRRHQSHHVRAIIKGTSLSLRGD